jgi:hypothetical protein
LLALHGRDGVQRLFPPFLSMCADNHRASQHLQVSFMASTSRPRACSLRWTRGYCWTLIVSGRHHIAEPEPVAVATAQPGEVVSVPGCVVTNGSS